MGFQKAKREQIWLKILLAGPSGSGKTYSALRLAQGIGKKIAFIDTENGRARYYASEFDFDDMRLEAPYTPEKYIAAIDLAVDNGYEVLIVDSSTHEWNYLLEMHDKMPGNSYTNWAKITPRHDAFTEKILQSPIHLITTVRGKDEYVIEDKDGKKTPKKVGLGYRQRDGMEYDYTATFNLTQDSHIANATKDNTHIFENRYDILTEKDGAALIAWANSGEAAAPVKKLESPAEKELPDILVDIKKTIEICKANGVVREDIAEIIKSISGTANYNKITDFNQATAVLTALRKITE